MCIACALAVPAAFAPLREGGAPAGGDAFPSEAAEFPWPDGRRAGATLTWTGVAGFVLEAGTTRIAFDAFVTRPGLAATLLSRAEPDRAAVARAFSGLDAVFLGHAHYDHAMDVAAVAEASPRAVVHGGPTAAELARRLGVPASRVVEVRDGASATVGPFRVEAVAAAHGLVPWVRWVDRARLPASGVPRTPFRWPRGEVFAWRVEVGGRALHVQGSAGIDDPALRRQERCDALVACLAARAGTPRYLERLAERLRPAVLVPCHHDDFFRSLHEPPRPIATLRWAAFREEAAALAAAHGTRLFLPVRGRGVAI